MVRLDALKRLVDGGSLRSDGRGRGMTYRLARIDEPLNEPLNKPLSLKVGNQLTKRIFDEISTESRNKSKETLPASLGFSREC